jgi:hypothetical protein
LSRGGRHRNLGRPAPGHVANKEMVTSPCGNASSHPASLVNRDCGCRSASVPHSITKSASFAAAAQRPNSTTITHSTLQGLHYRTRCHLTVESRKRPNSFVQGGRSALLTKHGICFCSQNHSKQQQNKIRKMASPRTTHLILVVTLVQLLSLLCSSNAAFAAPTTRQSSLRTRPVSLFYCSCSLFATNSHNWRIFSRGSNNNNRRASSCGR